ncbi:MAG: methyltransferase domain-containing protein [Clostridiales bacterium]|nr:methyltransferase domain-containing protein [Clostridiales bacterium]
MNTVWSTYIQSIGTLYGSRALRFSDLFKEQYKEAFGIKADAKILEIGCGPGALCEALLRWYPNSNISGIDRDSNFIDFARKNSADIDYREADAACLPYDDGSFDVTISNTVAEHIEPSAFYGEQRRVLKDGGVCIVLSARRGINIKADCIKEESDFEKELWERTEKYFIDAMKRYEVCSYPQSEAELPMCMQKYGFKNVSTKYLTVNLTPDDPKYTKETAYAMINADRKNDIDNIDAFEYVAPGVVSREEAEALKKIVNEKYDKRISLYDQGKKQWDTNMSLTMVIRGEK